MTTTYDTAEQVQVAEQHPQLAEFKAREAYLMASIRRAKERLTLPDYGDSLERAVGAHEREAAAGDIHSIERELRNTQHAISLCKSGQFGLCADCGGRIAPKRLAAIVGATRCIVCAEGR